MIAISKKHKKKHNKSQKRLILAMSLFILLLSICVGSFFSDWSQILTNKKEAKLLSKEYKNLQEEENSLESEVTKLQDPEYIARYAREKFLYSKEGEIILRIPDIKNIDVES